jgi:hypothetical protein
VGINRGFSKPRMPKGKTEKKRFQEIQETYRGHK